MPELWESCLTNLHLCMAAISKISEDPNISTHDRLHSLSLLADCSQMKLSFISDATIIQEALRFIDQIKQRIVEIAPEQSRELLRSELRHQEGERQHQEESNFSSEGDDENSDSSATVAAEETDTSVIRSINDESLNKTDPNYSSNTSYATKQGTGEDDDDPTSDMVF